MKLINTNYGIELALEENMAAVIVIENATAFSLCIDSMWRQCEGEDGDWILSDCDKIISLAKKAVYVINPWSIDINNKKTISRLYLEMDEVMNSKFLDEYTDINTQLVSFIDGIIETIPYNLDMNFEIDLSGLLKLYDVKFEMSDLTLLEKIVTYIKITHQVCGIEFFAFIGLKSYLTEEECIALYEEMCNEKIYIILFESHFCSKIEKESVIIIDNDLCIIDL